MFKNILSLFFTLQVICVLLALVTSDDVTPGATSLEPEDNTFISKPGQSTVFTVLENNYCTLLHEDSFVG